MRRCAEGFAGSQPSGNERRSPLLPPVDQRQLSVRTLMVGAVGAVGVIAVGTASVGAVAAGAAAEAGAMAGAAAATSVAAGVAGAAAEVGGVVAVGAATAGMAAAAATLVAGQVLRRVVRHGVGPMMPPVLPTPSRDVPYFRLELLQAGSGAAVVAVGGFLTQVRLFVHAERLYTFNFFGGLGTQASTPHTSRGCDPYESDPRLPAAEATVPLIRCHAHSREIGCPDSRKPCLSCIASASPGCTHEPRWTAACCASTSREHHGSIRFFRRPAIRDVAPPSESLRVTDGRGVCVGAVGAGGGLLSVLGRTGHGRCRQMGGAVGVQGGHGRASCVRRHRAHRRRRARGQPLAAGARQTVTLPQLCSQQVPCGSSYRAVDNDSDGVGERRAADAL